jgi:UDP-glucuronate 4-epimerase
MTVLVTGTAGFIGNQVALALLEGGDRVIGLDSVTPYYDVTLKEARLERLKPNSDFVEARIDLADREAVTRLFEEHHPEKVINLAAQAGVRYSLESPHSYIDSNITGFLNILEACRHFGTEHLVYASTSSVYGANTAMPFSEHQSTEHQVSLYAATKKSDEIMAHSYSHLFGIPSTGLRFFTVYGPWGRPDMALFLFTKAILEDRPIDVFNNGDMQRDFTYVGDIVEGVVRVLDRPPVVSADWSGDDPDSASSGVAPYRVFNIGLGEPVQLMKYIEVLERKLGREAQKNFLPMQAGDVRATWADTADLEREVGYRPRTSVEAGVSAFVDWYLDYYKVEK